MQLSNLFGAFLRFSRHFTYCGAAPLRNSICPSSQPPKAPNPLIKKHREAIPLDNPPCYVEPSRELYQKPVIARSKATRQSQPRNTLYARRNTKLPSTPQKAEGTPYLYATAATPNPTTLPTSSTQILDIVNLKYPVFLPRKNQSFAQVGVKKWYKTDMFLAISFKKARVFRNFL